MTRNLYIILGFVALAAAGFIASGAISKVPTDSAGPAAATEIMYVCRETKKLSSGPRQPTPAVNPATGRATLLQALYCPECQKWRAAPPPELRERFPAGPTCPVHKAPLSETGPADRPLAATNR